MKFDITKLKSGIVSNISIDMQYDFDKSYLDMADLIDLRSVVISGCITRNYEGYDLNVKVKGTMVLPCSITLEPVNHEFEFVINDDVDSLLLQIDENAKKVGNTIDIFPIIWENILMEIPMKVVSPNAHASNLKGDGWRVVTEKEDSINPELEKLADLYKKEV